MTKFQWSAFVRSLACSALIVSVICLGSISPAVAAGPVVVQGSSQAPKIWLGENHPLSVSHTGPAAPSMSGAQPLSMVSADFDEDGVQDLLVGYSTPNGGVVAWHRGNLDAFAPQSDASFQAIGRGEFPSPFLPEVQTFVVPVNPDFIAAGDFTGQGHQDLAIAARGGNALYIFPGNGKGSFGAPQTVNLAGGITSLAAGELGSAHQTALLVGLSGQSGNSSSLWILAGSQQGVVSLARFSLKGQISNILFGEFGDVGPDAAFLAGSTIQILRSSTMSVGPVALPAPVRAFALGSFLFDRNGGSQIAALGANGSIQIAARNEFDPRAYTNDEFRAIRQARLRGEAPPLVPAHSFPGNGWRIVEGFPSVATIVPGQVPVFFRTRISVNGGDDIVWLNAASGQMVMISHADQQPGAPTFNPGQVSVKPYIGTPSNALPMRTNVDSRLGVVALHQGEVPPSLSMPIPDPTFTVNRTDDPTPHSPITNACNGVANDCSLREAILRSNGDTVMVPAGTYTLTRPKVANDCTGNSGALSVERTTTILGAGQNTTIIQAGTASYNPGPANGVDMVMNVNEDLGTANCPITNASASLSNLTLQNGHNLGTHGNDGDGGCMEFDTGSSGAATLTLDHVTLQNCDTTQGSGGGLANFNFVVATGTGFATITNSIIQGNSVADNSGGSSTAAGGGIWISDPSKIVMTASQVLNNLAIQDTATTGIGRAGGILHTSVGTVGETPQTQIHSSTISGNKAAFEGGGIKSTGNLLIDQSTIIINNKNGQGASGTHIANGGGLFVNPAVPALSATLSKVTIINNQSTGTGGGIATGAIGAGPVTINFSRLAGNTAGSTGSNLENLGSTVTATNDWWATNAPSGTIHTTAGATTFDPFIILTHPANPTKIKLNQSAGLLGDFTKDNHGNGAALSGNLDTLSGLAITWDSAVLGTITAPNGFTFLAGQTPATFNAGGTGGRGDAHITVDNVVVPVNSNLIASATEAGTTVTITTVGAHGFATGESVVIAGVGVSGYNGTFTITGTTTTTFTYTTGSGLAASSGGTAAVGIIILQPPSITKSFSPTTVAKNTPGTVTFSIDNSVNVVAIDSSFTDTLPAGLVVATTPNVVNNCGGSVTATAGAATIGFSNASLASGVCTINVDVQSAADNNYSNSVTIDSSDAGNGNTSTANLRVINPPAIAKAFGAATIPLNGTTSLTFTLTSSNTTLTLNGVAFTDNLPTGLINATPSNVTTNCVNGTATAVDGGASIALSGADLGPGASCTVSVNVQGSTAGAKTNSVQVTSTNGGTGNTSTASITVIAPPTISKAFGAASIPLNGTTTVTFTISNPNLTAAGDLTGVAFNDTLPSTTGTLVVSPTPNVSNTCNGSVTAPAGTGVISLSGGSVAHNASCTLSVDVKGMVEGDALNTTGAITSTEGGTGTTSNTALLKIVAPPGISKAFGASSIPLNGTTTVTFTITNPATNTAAENGIAFSDTLTGGLQVASTPGVSNSCSGTVTATANTTTISLTGGTIASPGTTCTVVVNVTGTQSGTVSNTTGAVSSTNGGTGATSNTATLTVAAPPTIQKAFGAATVPLNGTTSLTFTINNPNSNVTLNGVAFTDSLPAGLVVAPTPNVSNTCGGSVTAVAGAASLSLSGGLVNQGASCSLSLNVQGTTAGTKLNTTGAISSTEGGTGTSSNTASLNVIAPPTISKAFGAASIPLNGTTTVTFTISNPNLTAAGDLTGVAFSDTLPSTTGTLVVSPTPNVSNTCNGSVTATAGTGVISLSAGTVAHNASCTLSVDVKGTVEGDALNTTGAITSTEGGTGTTSNTALLKIVAPPGISKAFGASSIPLNGTTTVTFTITNPATNTAAENGIAFSDTLTGGLQVASTPGVSNSCSGTVTATANTTTISLMGGSIATPGSACTVVVNVTGTQSGTVSNTTGAVSSTNGGTGATSNAATLTVAGPPTSTKQFTLHQIPRNGTTTLTINITNPNTNVTLTGIAFTDSFPAGLVVAPTPSGSNTCGGTFNPVAGAGSVSLSGGTLAASASCAVSVSVQGATAGIKTNSVTVTSTEGGAGISSSDSITVVGPPIIIKGFGAASIAVNGPSTSLSFTIQNNNSTVGLTGVAFSDTLPAGLIISTPNGLSGACGGGTITATQNTNVISLSGGTIAASSSCTFAVNVKGTAAGTQTNTTGNISATESGTGGTAQASVNVDGPPAIAKAFNPPGIQPNGVSTLTITITNPAANPDPANGVAFTDNFPANLVVATPNNLINNCGGTATATSGSSSLALTGGSIPVNGSCTVSVSVTATPTGSYLNTTGPVSSTNGGTGGGGSANLFVAKPPTIQKVFVPNSTVQGGTALVSFTINNNNSNSTPPDSDVTLTGISFTDLLPAGLQVAAIPNVSNDCGGTLTANPGSTSITLTGGSLAPAVPLIAKRGSASATRLAPPPIADGACFVSVKVQATAAGTLNNTTGPISANESGPGPGSNTATLTVAPPPTAPTASKAFGAATIQLTATTSLTFNITNPNASVSLVNISLSDALPAGLIVASPSGLSGTCVTNDEALVTAVPGSQSINMTGLTLLGNGSCSYTVNVTAVGIGAQNNTTGQVTATFDDGTGTFVPITGGTASASVTVVAPIFAITKTHSGNFSQRQVGATYTINVSNTGNAPTVGTVTVTDTVPAGLVGTGFSGTGWNCNVGLKTCDRSDALNPGSSYPPLTLTVNVLPNAPASVTNSATVSGGGAAGPATANDPTTVIKVGPPIVITPDPNSTTVTTAAGFAATFTFTVDQAQINPPATVITFTCSGLPVGTSCNFSPLGEAQPVSQVTLTITTLGRGNSASVLPFGGGRPPIYAVLLFSVFGLAGISLRGNRGRKARLRLALAFAGLMIFLALSGCGGNPLVTPPGTYPITVTGTADTPTGTVTGSATVNLHVL